MKMNMNMNMKYWLRLFAKITGQKIMFAEDLPKGIRGKSIEIIILDNVYENYPCAECGNFTIVRSTGWSICDCCGMKVEMD